MDHIDKTNKKYNQYSKAYPKWAVDAMDMVLKLQGPERWRAAAAVYMNLNPINPETGLSAKEEYAVVVNQLKSKRDSLKTKWGEIAPAKAGTVGGGDFRESIEMPEGMWGMIKQFDMTAFNHNNPEAKSNLKKLRLEFPELCVAEKL